MQISSKGGIPELRVPGCGSCREPERCASGRGHRGMARQKRTARWRCVGPEHPAADPRLHAVFADHLKEHAVARRGLFPAGVAARRPTHAPDGAQSGISCADLRRRHIRKGCRRSGLVLSSAMDPAARGRANPRIHRAGREAAPPVDNRRCYRADAAGCAFAEILEPAEVADRCGHGGGHSCGGHRILQLGRLASRSRVPIANSDNFYCRPLSTDPNTGRRLMPR
jgi:hypothetical protein